MQQGIELLQNGSDIRGTALEGIKGQSVNLTPQISSTIAKAFACWISDRLNIPIHNLKIALGKDSRISGEILKSACANALSELGVTVLDCGLATTPAMFMVTQFSGFNAHGSIMITASHLPFNKNGFKFFTSASGLEKQDITRLIEIAKTANWPHISKAKGDIILKPCIYAYSEFLVDKVRTVTGLDKPLEGSKIIVDAGNGAGGFFAAQVLQVLGANTKGSLFLEPDGRFPNHAPNPEDAVAIGYLKKAVLAENADLGIIFDTDVDRAAIVDHNGQEINRNKLIGLLSAIVLEQYPGSSIVTDSVTSEGLSHFIEELGGNHHRFKRGYKNVINEAIRLNNTGQAAYLAIETSGHGAFRENYFLDDGAFIVAQVLIRFSALFQKKKSISGLIEKLNPPIEEKEIRIKIIRKDFKYTGSNILDRLPKFIETIPGWTLQQPNFEGHRVKCDVASGNGWFLLRMSLHEPILPLNIESDTEGGISIILSKLQPFFKDFSGIDSAALT